MSSSPFIKLSSPLSDLGTMDPTADDMFMDPFLRELMRPSSFPPVAIKTEDNLLQESPVFSPDQVTEKSGSKSRSRSKPNPTEVPPRRRSTRVPTAPSRFKPELGSHRPANTSGGESSDTQKNTPTVSPTVIPTNDNPVTPIPKVHAANSGRFTVKLTFAVAENIAPSGPGSIVAEDISFKGDRGRCSSQQKEATPMTEGSTIGETSPAPPNRSNQTKKPAARKPKTAVKQTTASCEDSTSSLSSDTPTRTRKRMLSEEPAKHSYKKAKSGPRTSLVIEASARRTRSQNASASTELVGASRVSGIQTPRKPAIKTGGTKSSAAKTRYVPPRLSAVHFVAPLRAMVRSAILHYSTLPTDLTDVDAVANLYRTFCALDIYRRHLKTLGLEGDDKDVRDVMSQVWQLVDSGEKDEEAIWKILVATWDSQGASGWGNRAKV